MKKAILLLFALLSTLLAASFTASAAECPYRDGRLNDRPHRDCGAPVAIFQTDSLITVLAPNPAGGAEGFVLRAARDNNIPSDHNVILETGTNPINGRPAVLSRLTTGEYQLNTFFANGDGYVVVWYGYDDLYHLDPVTGAPLDGAQPIIVSGATNPGAGASSAPVNMSTGSSSSSSSTSVSPDNFQGLSLEESGFDEALPQSESAPGAVSLSNCRVKTNRIVRLRSAPNTTDSIIVTRLPFDTNWTVTERTADWFRVIYKNTQGWVHSDFVTPTGACDLS